MKQISQDIDNSSLYSLHYTTKNFTLNRTTKSEEKKNRRLWTMRWCEERTEIDVKADRFSFLEN